MHVCPTTRVSDRHLTVNVGMLCGDQGIKTAWQTRWLVAVHLDPLVREQCRPTLNASSPVPTNVLSTAQRIVPRSTKRPITTRRQPWRVTKLRNPSKYLIALARPSGSVTDAKDQIRLSPSRNSPTRDALSPNDQSEARPPTECNAKRH